jgi:hypothetical protein
MAKLRPAKNTGHTYKKKPKNQYYSDFTNLDEKFAYYIIHTYQSN